MQKRNLMKRVKTQNLFTVKALSESKTIRTFHNLIIGIYLKPKRIKNHTDNILDGEKFNNFCQK